MTTLSQWTLYQTLYFITKYQCSNKVHKQFFLSKLCHEVLKYKKYMISLELEASKYNRLGYEDKNVNFESITIKTNEIFQFDTIR